MIIYEVWACTSDGKFASGPLAQSLSENEAIRIANANVKHLCDDYTKMIVRKISTTIQEIHTAYKVKL